MGPLTTVFILIFFISFVVFVIFFGRLPALRNTPIGALNRLLRVVLPRRLLALDRRLTNGRLHASVSRFLHYLMHERHPTVLIFFILLMTIPEFLFLPQVMPTLGFSMQVTCVFVVLCPYVFLYLAVTADPGYVVNGTLDLHGSLYPYDHILFLPGSFCKTCRQPKPPRSKHCSICGHCVAKMDHHCIFINGCVGYGNQHWFLLLLITTAVLTTTGALLGGSYLIQLIRTVAPPFYIWHSGLSWLDYFSVWSLGLEMDPKVGCVTLLCLLISPLIWGLFIYSTYLVYRGTTTNESGKWADVQLDIVDGVLFRQPLSHDRQRDLRTEPDIFNWPKITGHTYTRRYDASSASALNRPGEDEWEKVTTLDVIENIYDIGFRKNLSDVFFPRRYL